MYTSKIRILFLFLDSEINVIKNTNGNFLNTFEKKVVVDCRFSKDLKVKNENTSRDNYKKMIRLDWKRSKK